MALFTWTGGAASGDLDNGANWDQMGAVPSGTDTAVIGSFTIDSGGLLADVTCTGTGIAGGSFNGDVAAVGCNISAGGFTEDLTMTGGGTFSGGFVFGTFTATNVALSADPGTAINAVSGCSYDTNNFSNDIIDNGGTFGGVQYNGAVTSTGGTITSGSAQFNGAVTWTSGTINQGAFNGFTTILINCTVAGMGVFNASIDMTGGTFGFCSTIGGTSMTANGTTFNDQSPPVANVYSTNCTYTPNFTITATIDDTGSSFDGDFSIVTTINGTLFSNSTFDGGSFIACGINVGDGIDFGSGSSIVGCVINSGTSSGDTYFNNSQVNGGTWVNTTYFQNVVDVNGGSFDTMDFSGGITTTGVTSILSLTGFSFNTFFLSATLPAASAVNAGSDTGSFSGTTAQVGTARLTYGRAG